MLIDQHRTFDPHTLKLTRQSDIYLSIYLYIYIYIYIYKYMYVYLVETKQHLMTHICVHRYRSIYIYI